jgi:hypothetical protein
MTLNGQAIPQLNSGITGIGQTSTHGLLVGVTLGLALVLGVCDLLGVLLLLRVTLTLLLADVVLVLL